MGMSWCKCPFEGMPWCKYSDPNTNYSKIPFIFKMRCLQRLKIKIFSKLDLSFPKGSSLFLKVPKNWWSLLEIPKWGVDLKSDDLAQKIYLHKLVEQRDGTFKALFWKNEWSKFKKKMSLNAWTFHSCTIIHCMTYCIRYLFSYLK